MAPTTRHSEQFYCAVCQTVMAITKQVNCDTLEMNVGRSNAHLKLHALLCRLQVVGGESYKMDGLVKIVPVLYNAHQEES